MPGRRKDMRERPLRLASRRRKSPGGGFRYAPDNTTCPPFGLLQRVPMCPSSADPGACQFWLHPHDRGSGVSPVPKGHTGPAAQRQTRPQAGAGRGRPGERRGGAPDSGPPERREGAPQGRARGRRRRGQGDAPQGTEQPPSKNDVLLGEAGRRRAEGPRAAAQQNTVFAGGSKQRNRGAEGRPRPRLRYRECSEQEAAGGGFPAICLDTSTCNYSTLYVRRHNYSASFFQFDRKIYTQLQRKKFSKPEVPGSRNGGVLRHPPYGCFVLCATFDFRSVNTVFWQKYLYLSI